MRKRPRLLKQSIAFWPIKSVFIIFIWANKFFLLVENDSTSVLQRISRSQKNYFSRAQNKLCPKFTNVGYNFDFIVIYDFYYFTREYSILFLKAITRFMRCGVRRYFTTVLIGSPITNQVKSNDCWIFANILVQILDLESRKMIFW